MNSMQEKEWFNRVIKHGSAMRFLVKQKDARMPKTTKRSISYFRYTSDLELNSMRKREIHRINNPINHYFILDGLIDYMASGKKPIEEVTPRDIGLHIGLHRTVYFFYNRKELGQAYTKYKNDIKGYEAAKAEALTVYPSLLDIKRKKHRESLPEEASEILNKLIAGLGSSERSFIMCRIRYKELSLLCGIDKKTIRAFFSLKEIKEAYKRKRLTSKAN